ncbi:hypothetical protein TNCV_3743401 [Trichonephila clavipes]|nr:hypothetical protein TNCV_3743401 [Trichonephila clavipes]
MVGIADSRDRVLVLLGLMNFKFLEAEISQVDVLRECIPAEVSLCYLTKVLDESRSFFRVHTGYFSNIPKCIKAEFIASWGCSQSSVVSSSKR